ncbi:gluconate kinase, SKI family [Mesorhizobium sp. YR577]|nr:gluconate kinase, SKI family [Mesorhizobium sp. YR577]
MTIGMKNAVAARSDFLVVMGIAGTGKTEIASRLAEALACQWIEADRLHSAENVERMRQGIGLTDEQRWPWLAAICDAALAEPGRPVVIACSALRRRYRDFMRDRLGPVRFLFLEGSAALIEQRLGARKSHFATTSLLASQLATLEPPTDEENPVRLDIALTPAEIVAQTVAVLRAE